MLRSETARRDGDIRLSFEFFPPKNAEMETQLWETVAELKKWNPDFVSVTYGAGGSTKAPTLDAVRRMIGDSHLATAAHLTCVDASRDEVHQVVDEFRNAGVRHFVALRGDPSTGIGTAYQPHPQGYENAAALVKGLKELGDFEISVSAYPEKHPESASEAVDIDMLKRKVDNGATRAITQFFFDNLTTAIEFVRAGKLRALGLTSAQRNPMVPDLVPINETMPELKPFDVSTWFGVFLPANTPKPIVDSLNLQMKAWLADPKTLDRFKTMAGFPAYGTPDQFKAFVDAQIAQWKGVIDKEGLKLDVN